MTAPSTILRATLLRELALHIPGDAEEAQMLRALSEFVRDNGDCCSREAERGHVTASAWVVDSRLQRVLLLHHGKLNRWLQPGGHIESGDTSACAAALREATEETGLTFFRQLGTVFDVDVHDIPGRHGEPPHVHYDVRYAFLADPGEPLAITRESRELGWFPVADAARLSNSESVQRMIIKTEGLRALL